MSADNHHGEHADGILEAGQKAPNYFYILYFGLIIWGVIFMAYYLLSGWSSSQEFEEKMAAHTGVAIETPATTPAASSAAIDAHALFAANCSGCHGADGKGGFGTDLSRSSYDYGKDTASVKNSITKGRGGKMPPFAGQLSDAEIDALVNFSIKL